MSNQFAVEELKKLSDSGVYETLKLVDIVEGSRHVRKFAIENCVHAYLMYC